MFITYDQNGKVTAYSDKQRNVLDLKEGEKEVEVDMEFQLVSCKEGGLTYSEGKSKSKGELKNDGKIIANEK